MLTGKQEKFVRNLLDGMSQREAYKNSYNAENMTDKSIDEEACRLLKEHKIASRYQELQDQLANASIMSAIERLEYLTGVIKETELEKIKVVHDGFAMDVERVADFNTKLKAIDLMNKMQGEYTTKIEGSLKVKKLEDLL